jgi:hypothetical protein
VPSVAEASSGGSSAAAPLAAIEAARAEADGARAALARERATHEAQLLEVEATVGRLAQQQALVEETMRALAAEKRALERELRARGARATNTSASGAGEPEEATIVPAVPMSPLRRYAEEVEAVRAAAAQRSMI